MFARATRDQTGHQTGRGRRPPRRTAGFRPLLFLWSTATTALVLIAGLPYLGDAAHGVFLQSQDPQACRIVSVIDGDTVALFCPASSGLEVAALAGHSAPDLFRPACRDELRRAFEAQWKLRGLLWGAGEIGIVKQGTGPDGARQIFLSLDGAPVSRAMIAAGMAQSTPGGWCTA